MPELLRAANHLIVEKPRARRSMEPSIGTAFAMIPAKHQRPECQPERPVERDKLVPPQFLVASADGAPTRRPALPGCAGGDRNPDRRQPGVIRQRAVAVGMLVLDLQMRLLAYPTNCLFRDANANAEVNAKTCHAWLLGMKQRALRPSVHHQPAEMTLAGVREEGLKSVTRLVSVRFLIRQFGDREIIEGPVRVDDELRMKPFARRPVRHNFIKVDGQCTGAVTKAHNHDRRIGPVHHEADVVTRYDRRDPTHPPAGRDLTGCPA